MYIATVLLEQKDCSGAENNYIFSENHFLLSMYQQNDIFLRADDGEIRRSYLRRALAESLPRSPPNLTLLEKYLRTRVSRSEESP